MFKSRSVASLSRSGIYVHTQAYYFHNVTAAVRLKQQSASSKKKCREKRKANLVYEKERTNRKWQDSWKWDAAGEEHLWLTNDEVKSSIGDHRTSLYIVECTIFKLEGIKDHERSTLHEHHINTAQAKKGPRQTDGARLEKLLMQQQTEKMILLNSECPC